MLLVSPKSETSEPFGSSVHYQYANAASKFHCISHFSSPLCGAQLIDIIESLDGH